MECGIQKVRISQMSLAKHDNQQREVRVSSQQKHETRILKPKRESRALPAECELRVSEPCVSDLRCKDSFQKLKSPRKPEAVLFDPLRRIKGLSDKEEECSSNRSIMLL